MPVGVSVPLAAGVVDAAGVSVLFSAVVVGVLVGVVVAVAAVLRVGAAVLLGISEPPFAATHLHKYSPSPVPVHLQSRFAGNCARSARASVNASETARTRVRRMGFLSAISYRFLLYHRLRDSGPKSLGKIAEKACIAESTDYPSVGHPRASYERYRAWSVGSSLDESSPPTSNEG